MRLDIVLQNLDGLIWLLVLLIPFNLIQQQVHKEIQTIFYLITRKRKAAISLFALVFLPGVFLHEISHLIVARLTGVKTGRFSLLPKSTSRGQLQLGYVETERTDWLRGSIIGAAPLIAGGSLIAYLASNHLDLPVLWDLLVKGNSIDFWSGLLTLPDKKSFWLLAYLIFVVSSTMMPSDSDRHAWLPMGLTMVCLLMVVTIAGAGPWVVENLAPSLNKLFIGLAMVLGISGILHIILYLPSVGIHKLLVKITGYDIV
ncbi:hypothetical protein ACFLXB_04630 [Chloroflexota bacterium]